MKFVIKRFSAFAIIFFALAASHVLTGCDGSDANKAAKETVEELSGKNIVDKGEKIKQQIDTLSAEQIEKVQQDINNGTYSREQENEGK